MRRARQLGRLDLSPVLVRAFVGGVAAIALLLMPSSAQAWCQSCSVSRVASTCSQPCTCDEADGEKLLAWRRSCMSYYLHQDGARDLERAEVEAALQRSFDSWNAVDCGGGRMAAPRTRLGTEPTQMSTPEFVPGGGNANSIAFVDDWSARGNASSAYALTTTWFSTRTGEIFDADMEINQQNWQWTICPDAGCADGRVDLENTITHEAGHFLGLAHTGGGSGTGDDQSTMWACAPAGEVLKRDLSTDDIEGICAIYPEGQLDDSCDYEPIGGFDPVPRVLRPGSGCCGATPAAPNRVHGLWLGLALILYRRRARKGRRSGS